MPKKNKNFKISTQRKKEMQKQVEGMLPVGRARAISKLAKPAIKKTRSVLHENSNAFLKRTFSGHENAARAAAARRAKRRRPKRR